jgi:regulator of sigma E protease
MPIVFQKPIVFFVLLGIMVLVHEFGHFIVAKLFGVRVEIFSIGFGKRLLGFKRGETDYRLSLIPLGGYVKMSGELAGDGTPLVDEASSQPNPGDPGDFTNHPRWQRILIGLAGPCCNFLLAFALMATLFKTHNEVPAYISQPVVVDSVVPGTPMAKAGIQAGDRIVRFDSAENPTWEQLEIRVALDLNSTVPVTIERGGQAIQTTVPIENPDHRQDFNPEALGLMPRIQDQPVTIAAIAPGRPAAKAGLQAKDQLAAVDGHRFTNVRSLVAYLQQAAGRTVELTVQRGAETLHYKIQPVLADDGKGKLAYQIGFSAAPEPVKIEELSLPDAVRQSAVYNAQNAGYILEVLRNLFTRRNQVQNLSGPVGMFDQVGQAWEMPGLKPITIMSALISLNLGIFNLLPIPLLDGGMILLLLIEGIRRRDLDQNLKERVFQVAFVALILFAVFVTFNDVSRFSIFSKLKL